MKKLTHIIKTGAFALLTSLSVAACIDGNDWETISGNRLFGTTSFSVEPAAITAEAKWDATPNTEYYIIEASREQMDDNMPMGSASGSIVYGEDQSIKKSPYTLTGLLGETTYYLRIKSKWKRIPLDIFGRRNIRNFERRNIRYHSKRKHYGRNHFNYLGSRSGSNAFHHQSRNRCSYNKRNNFGRSRCRTETD